MRRWKRDLIAVGGTLEAGFDRFKFALKRRMGRLGPIELLPYRGYGTPDTLFLKGRALEAVGLAPPSAGDSRRRNLRNMTRRFLSSEIPHARVRASYGRHEVEAVADEEGFFDLRVELEAPAEEGTDWHPVEVELLWPRAGEGDTARATGSVLVPAGARFGVVSDLDDTVLRSSVTDLVAMARLTLLSNAHTRLPFEGVAAFYRALRLGPDGRDSNPIFYVSSSPWNLYDLLEDFLDLQGIPAGPLLLKDWSPTTLRDHEKHKLGAIRMLLATYPDLPFVLVGDSGERDPEIYRQIVREHPGRIWTIYIRDVSGAKRDAAVREIAGEVRELGVEMLLVSDSNEAADHAAGRGLIAPGSPPPLAEEGD